MTSRGSSELPLVSVGVLSWNRKDELRTTVAEILKFNYSNLEISVVDNGSTDGSAEMIKDEFPGIMLYEIGRNTGVAARNVILFEATGKYIVLYDDDSMPSTPATIGEIVDFMEQHTDVAAFCTNVIDYHTGRSETQGWENYATASADGVYEGAFIHGSGMAYRSNCIRQTRGFPDDFFWALEEGDLTLQLVSKNLKIVYNPDIITYHRRSPIDRDELWAFIMYTRNGIWLFWKYFPCSLALWLTFRYVLKQAAMTMGRPAYLLSFLKGVYLGFRGIPTQFAKREPLNKEAIRKTKKWRQQNVTVHYKRIINLLKPPFLK